MELAIVHAIRALSPLSKHGDGSCRCKDIYALVRDAAVLVNGQVQQGNHRFKIFSSALCGRRSAARLFLRVTDRERSGSWWGLRVPFEEAVAIASSLQGRPVPESDDLPAGVARMPKAEAIRCRFSALAAIGLLRGQLRQESGAAAGRCAELEQAAHRNPALAELQSLRAAAQAGGRPGGAGGFTSHVRD
jgi:hypothetical protein